MRLARQRPALPKVMVPLAWAMPFPVGEEQIKAAEEALGRRFPMAMRNRLSRSNGGEIETTDDCWFLYPVRDASDRRRLSRSCNDLVRETHLARKWRGFPSDAVAIAEDGTGNHLVLLHGSDEIHRWDHETCELSAVAVDWG